MCRGRSRRGLPALEGKEVRALVRVGKAGQRIELVRIGVNDADDRGAVFLLAVAEVRGVIVHIFISADPRQPIDKVAVVVLLLMERPIMVVPGDV